MPMRSGTTAALMLAAKKHASGETVQSQNVNNPESFAFLVVVS
jgi:hypothetical protein